MIWGVVAVDWSLVCLFLSVNWVSWDLMPGIDCLYDTLCALAVSCVCTIGDEPCTHGDAAVPVCSYILTWASVQTPTVRCCALFTHLLSGFIDPLLHIGWIALTAYML